ncbi:MAG: hypothetical protein C0404_03520 [Verrucomicrobia bacterium]|nr:hypothetical protein [Verrucomicrobiota bacterium]
MRNNTNALSDNLSYVRSDWIAAGCVSLAALIIYFVTLAPTVTLEQSGAFVVAGQYLGIGRVPGYPVWHLLAKLFISLFSFVRYRGYPNPAWATNFMSAFFGALSCGLAALIVSRVGRMLCSRPERAKRKAAASAVAAGILFAISHVMWSQSVITETHTLTLFFILLFIAVSLAWMSRPANGMAFVLAAVIGLGLAQSQIIVLLLPPLLLGLLLAEPRLCREFCVANVFLLVLPCILLLAGPSGGWFVVALASSGILGVAAPLRLSGSGKTALGMLLIIGLGLTLYAYLPLASEGKAPMQFGYARTWEGFKHVIARGQYERIQPTDVLGNPALFLDQLMWYAGLLNKQFIFPLTLVGTLPFVCFYRFRGPWLKWLAVCLLTFFMFSVVLVIGASPGGDVQDCFIQRVKFIPSFAIWSILVGIGLLMIVDWIHRIRLKKKDKEQDPALTREQPSRL